VLCDSREHAWADLVGIVESEDEIRPSLARERSMGAGLTLDLPTDPL